MNTTNTSAESTMSQSVKLLYTAKAHTTGGRREARPVPLMAGWTVKLSVPGTPGNGTNPEQLFAVGLVGLFHQCDKADCLPDEGEAPAGHGGRLRVDLCAGDDGYFLQTRSSVSLPGVGAAGRAVYFRRAHQTCPYSKATRGNINVEINLV